jgi:hypothetical protein
MKPKQNYQKAIAILKKELAGKQAARPEEVTEMTLDGLKRMVAVFQPRTLEGNLQADGEFINDLMGHLKMQGKRPLDPLTIWWSGKHFYVIDGHHRLEAYKRCGGPWDTLPIPVMEYRGGLNDAIAEAVMSNSKSKLPMRKEDRMNSAWKLVCIGEWSKREITGMAGVSERQVGNMREVHKALKALVSEQEFGPAGAEAVATWDDDQLAGMSWYFAQKELSPESYEEVDHDAVHAAAVISFTKRLLKTFGKQMSMKPEAFAEALASINDRLPIALITSDAWEPYRDESEERYRVEMEEEEEWGPEEEEAQDVELGTAV